MTVKLRIVQGRPAGMTMQFPPGEYIFGRGAECHVRPDSAWVSRQHCQLRVTSEEVFLRDLGSRNGTLVNGVRVQEERALNDGDEVHIGPLVFKVLIEEPRPEELVSAKPGEVVHVVSLTGTEPVLGTLTTAEQPAFPAANSAKKR